MLVANIVLITHKWSVTEIILTHKFTIILY